MIEEYGHEPRERHLATGELLRWIGAQAKSYWRPLTVLTATGLMLAAADSLLPLVTAWIIDDATGRGGGLGPGWDIFVYLVLASSVAGFVFTFILMAGRTSTGIGYDVRRKAFAHLQRLSLAYYDRRAVGWLMARLTSDCARLASIVPWVLLDLVWGTAFATGVCLAMLWLDVRLGLVVMTVIPCLALSSVYFQRKLLRSQRLVRRTNSRLTASFHEAIVGVRTTKVLVREEDALAEFQRLSGTMHRYCVRNLLESALYLPAVVTIGSVGVGLALWRGGGDVLVGDLSPGTLVAFLQYAGLLFMPVQEMAERLAQFQAARASAERLHELLDTEPEILDPPPVLRAWNEGEVDLGGRIRSVVFDGVTFGYEDDPPVLESFHLEVGEGESIALVGETGSGKSTLVSLLCRFYEPRGGEILLNGIAYRRIPLPALRDRIAIVLQTPHLFDGSLLDNVRYGRLEASLEEVRAAAERVGARAMIEAMPEGWETRVGEGGTRLSVGQRQMVSLARAVLADPEILILDEATSSVDAETERLIQQGIDRILEGRIAFVIAHRLATVRRCDRIVVMEHGEILEQGTHAELLARRGAYRRLHEEQSLAEGEREILLGAEGETRRGDRA